MLESRDQGKPFINAKMIDVPGSAQVRFQNDSFIEASHWFGTRLRQRNHFESYESIFDILQISSPNQNWTDRIIKKRILVLFRVQESLFKSLATKTVLVQNQSLRFVNNRFCPQQIVID